MRLVKLILSDIYFQYKYGFYLLYSFFTLVYIAVLFLLPEDWKNIAGTLIIFSDPALIGLVFMGVLILFEKSERVINSIAVSPVTAHQYTISKVCSISIISLICALLIAWIGAEIICLPTFVLGLLMGALFFSLIGLLIGVKSVSLNGFLIGISPVMVLATGLAALYLMGYNHWIMQLFPSVAVVNLILFLPELILISVCVLIIWIAVFYCLTVCAVKGMMKSLGGVKI